jgi:adenylate cyclase class 2
MAQETEIKCKVADRKAFGRTLRRLRAAPVGKGKAARVHEMNVLFDTPESGLAKHGQLLRVRVERQEGRPKRGANGDRVVLTYKSPAMSAAAPVAGSHLVPAGRHKVREEIEVEVADVHALTQILEGLGLRGWFRYEKYRTTYRLPRSAGWAKDLLIELDETPVGNYVELEGPPEAIDRAAGLLGFSRTDYITKNYLQLYLEDCRRRGQTPTHMLFADKKSS